MPVGFDRPVNLVRHPAVIVWSVLVAATVASWWLGLHHGMANTAIAAGTLILIITFIKIYLVGMYFMEIRHSRMLLVGVFSVWTVLTGAATLGLYIFATLA